MAYTRESLRILSLSLGVGLVVAGITIISIGSLPAFGITFGIGALILLFQGVYEMKPRNR